MRSASQAGHPIVYPTSGLSNHFFDSCNLRACLGLLVLAESVVGACGSSGNQTGALMPMVVVAGSVLFGCKTVA